MFLSWACAHFSKDRKQWYASPWLRQHKFRFPFVSNGEDLFTWGSRWFRIADSGASRAAAALSTPSSHRVRNLCFQKQQQLGAQPLKSHLVRDFHIGWHLTVSVTDWIIQRRGGGHFLVQETCHRQFGNLEYWTWREVLTRCRIIILLWYFIISDCKLVMPALSIAAYTLTTWHQVFLPLAVVLCTWLVSVCNLLISNAFKCANVWIFATSSCTQPLPFKPEFDWHPAAWRSLTRISWGRWYADDQPEHFSC